MMGPVTPEARLRSAKILHGSLLAGVVMLLLVTGWVHGTTSPILGPNVGSAFTISGLAVLAAALIALRFLPSPDDVPAVAQASAQWGTSLSRMIVRWSVIQGACLVNAVLWFITRDRVSLGATLVGLTVLLLFLRPARELE